MRLEAGILWFMIGMMVTFNFVYVAGLTNNLPVEKWEYWVPLITIPLTIITIITACIISSNKGK